MFYEKIKTDKEMIDYLIDCTLATVEKMIGKKSTPKEGEFKRQCDIAQKGIDYIGRDYKFESRAKKFAKTQTSFEYYKNKHKRLLGE